MYPTFPKGSATNSAQLETETVLRVLMRRFPSGINLRSVKLFQNIISRGDIISFENSITDQITSQKSGVKSGFIKRVIAIPGDTLQIRDGFVYINGQIQTENYTASGRSTFGGQFLSDCKPLTIPSGFVFVMGDNRKGSSDSRHELTLVPISDIDHYLPLSEQINYSNNWRDASKDTSQSLKPLLDKQVYLNMLNEKRRENNLIPLKYQPKLESSAGIRAGIILKYDDLSFDATKSGITMAKAMAQSGYSNTIWGEAPTLGYYDSAELLENYFAFENTKKFLLNPDFQETGISAQIGLLNGCPVQIVVQHLAGFKPPNYSADVITSWKNNLKGLQDSLPSWEKLKSYTQFYKSHQKEVDELLGLFATRISRNQAIVNKMAANQWLSDEEQAWTKEEESLSSRMSALTTILNSY